MTHNCRKVNCFLKQITNKHKTLQKISDNISNKIVIIIPHSVSQRSVSVVLRDLQLIIGEDLTSR